MRPHPVRARRFRQFFPLLATLSILATGTVWLSAPASAAACGTMNLGSGTSADPWQVWTANDIASIETGSTCIGPGGASYFIQMADIVKTTSTPIDQSSLARYDGNNHSVTITGVTGFAGLFTGTNNDTITRLAVLSSGSTLANDKGWVADTDTGSTFSFITTNGDISSSGGGIVGRNAKNTTIEDSYTSGAIGLAGGGLVGAIDNTANGYSVTVRRSHSSGAIGDNGGGLVGMVWSGSERTFVISDSYSTGTISDNAGGLLGAYTGTNYLSSFSITGSFSTGAIAGIGAGGLLGAYAGSNGDASTISNSFSTGGISGIGAGGLLGREALSVDGEITIANSYTTGNITGLDSGGMVGKRTTPAGNLVITNSYTSGSSASTTNGYISNGTAIVTSSYSEAANSGSGWSDTHAASALTGVPAPTFGANWGSCLANQPYFIAGFYPRNPCLASTSVTFNGSGATPSNLTIATDGIFTGTSTYATDPLSYVSVVSDSTTANVGGTTCTLSADCRLPDVLQGSGSAATVTVSGSGTVRIMRYDSTTLRTTQLGTLTLTVPSPSPSPSTDSTGSATSPESSSSTSTAPTTSPTEVKPPLAAPTINFKMVRGGHHKSVITVRGTTTGLPMGTELKSQVRTEGKKKVRFGKPAKVRWDGRFTWKIKSSKPVTVYFIAPNGTRSVSQRR